MVIIFVSTFLMFGDFIAGVALAFMGKFRPEDRWTSALTAFAACLSAAYITMHCFNSAGLPPLTRASIGYVAYIAGAWAMRALWLRLEPSGPTEFFEPRQDLARARALVSTLCAALGLPVLLIAT
ncbi:MAG: hypothetical protein IV100_01650 [Myxococcales bacterium]|nr:hypothetical protein [Myxococcales bacterium]